MGGYVSGARGALRCVKECTCKYGDEYFSVWEGGEEDKDQQKKVQFIRYVNKPVLFLTLHTLCTIWSVPQSWHFVSDGSWGECIGTTRGGGTASKGAIFRIP